MIAPRAFSAEFLAELRARSPLVGRRAERNAILARVPGRLR
jgi:hypothetical protein